MRSAIGFCILAATAIAALNCSGSSSNGGSSSVVVSNDGNTIKLLSATFQVSSNATDPNKGYVLSLTDYDQCNWIENHDPSSLPKNSALLGIYPVNESNNTITPPVPGTYQVATPTVAGLFINPSYSGFGVITNCKGNWPGILFGTLTISSITNTSAQGSVDITLTDGTTIKGMFSTETCSGNVDTSPAANDPDACTSVQ